jgi:hypothetical protein
MKLNNQAGNLLIFKLKDLIFIKKITFILQKNSKLKISNLLKIMNTIIN